MERSAERCGQGAQAITAGAADATRTSVEMRAYDRGCCSDDLDASSAGGDRERRAAQRQRRDEIRIAVARTLVKLNRATIFSACPNLQNGLPKICRQIFVS